MRFSIRAIAVAGGIVWGGAILFVGLVNLVAPGYGMNFLQMMSSIYPWIHATHGLERVAIGTVAGLIDGAIAAVIFAWLYNIIAAPSHASHAN
ncbi:MAG: hypothetical protein WA755_01135 [Candidatus Acidiferrales bacterium]